MARPSRAYKQAVAALRGMPQAYLVCRDLKHAWDYEVSFYKTAFKGRTEKGRRFAIFARRELKCIRCDARRNEVFAINKREIAKVSSHYNYPEGYLLHGVAELKDIIGLVRLEQIQRELGNIA